MVLSNSGISSSAAGADMIIVSAALSTLPISGKSKLMSASGDPAVASDIIGCGTITCIGVASAALSSGISRPGIVCPNSATSNWSVLSTLSATAGRTFAGSTVNSGMFMGKSRLLSALLLDSGSVLGMAVGALSNMLISGSASSAITASAGVYGAPRSKSRLESCPAATSISALAVAESSSASSEKSRLDPVITAALVKSFASSFCTSEADAALCVDVAVS